MLKCTVVKPDGTETALRDPLTVTLDCDLDIPADSVTLTCPFDREIYSTAEGVRIYDGGKLLLKGNIDELSVIKESAGVILKISARSPAAALLDCEADPLVYNNPNLALIADKHLLPFGITPAEADPVPYYNIFKIDKGMTHWQVLQRFCRSRYNAEPRVTGDGTAYVQGFPPQGKVTFSDFLPNDAAISYFSLKESDRRHRLISDVKVKFNPANGYRSVIRNPHPRAKNMRRTRYVNASLNYSTLSNAYRILSNSNRESYELTLECSGCRAGLTGCSATVQDSVLGALDGLTVTKVKYTAGSRGERSVITLKKENCDVVDELHNE